MDGRTGAIIKLVNLAASATSLDGREEMNGRAKEQGSREPGLGAGAMPNAAVIRLRGCEAPSAGQLGFPSFGIEMSPLAVTVGSSEHAR